MGSMSHEISVTEEDKVLDLCEDSDDIYAGREDWLTRSEVAALLRVSIATVRRLQGRDLHPARSGDGPYLFDPNEVEQVRANRPLPPEPRTCADPGELAAEAFKLFREGVDVRDVVIALRRPPGEVAELYASWERMGDSIVISPKLKTHLQHLVTCRLLEGEIMAAIENDDPESLKGFTRKMIASRRKVGGTPQSWTRQSP
jgi:hypothetical protein